MQPPPRRRPPASSGTTRRPPAYRSSGPSPHHTASILQKWCPGHPRLALVLGSGWQGVPNHFNITKSYFYSKLPGFTRPAVKGHEGKILACEWGGISFLVLVGRTHYYEGFDMERITFPIRALAACGVESLILTNAAGGITRKFKTGDFMLVKDHINFMGANPLRGRPQPDDQGGSRFVDLSETYDAQLRKGFKAAAKASRTKLREGVYMAVSGPSYETPAEIKAFARMGADAIGMSTVPEAIVARHCGMKVAAISCITNAAAGLSSSGVHHEDVLRTGQEFEANAAAFLTQFIQQYAT
jgi:purine-nucleoside phosphorylase